MNSDENSSRHETGFGALLIFLSAILFSVNILLVKIIRTETAIPVVEITFARFFLGLLIVAAYIWGRRI